MARARAKSQVRRTWRGGAWRWLLGICVGCFALGAGVLVTISVLAAHTPVAVPGSAGDKLSQVGDQANTAAVGVHAPKAAIATTTNVSTCPRGAVHTGLFTGDNGGFHAHILNEAVIAPNASSPFEYIVFAGGSLSDAQQGVLIEVRLDADPCSATATGTQVHYYLTPTRSGPVTLTQISGSLVVFVSGSGGQGQFDIINGTFR